MEGIMEEKTTLLVGAVARDVPDPLAKSIRETVDALPMEDSRFTIIRVPAQARKNHEHYYEPQLVSIGPLHSGKDHLRVMEERKWRYLHDLLSRGSSNGSLEACVKKMRALELQTRSCYAESFHDICSDQFVQMMLLDGCFILEFVLKQCCCKADTVLKANWCLPLVRSDLIMLENQIPFFVLQCSFDLLVGSVAKLSLAEILIIYLTAGKERSPPSCEIHHLLHLYHYCFLSPPSCLLTGPRRKSGWKTIPCAIELQQAGVKLKKKQGNILDVTFRNGVLGIPVLKIEGTTRSRYENLLLFEQWVGKEEHFTSYAIFMNCIIKTQRDVAILQRCGIIDSMLSSKEEVVDFFSHLIQYAFVDDDHYLAGLFEDVNQYCESKWPTYWPKVKRDYFLAKICCRKLVRTLDHCVNNACVKIKACSNIHDVYVEAKACCKLYACSKVKVGVWNSD